MKFGYFCNTTNWSKKPYAELLDEARDISVYCDKNKWNSVWFSEHHFNHEGMESCPNPLVIGTDIAARTKNIRIGQAANIITFHNPIRLAEDIATLDQLSKGRVEIGVGRGIYGREAINMNVEADLKDQAKNFRLFEETLTILKKAWKEKFFSHQGEFYTYPSPNFIWQHDMSPPSEEFMDLKTKEIKKIIRSSNIRASETSKVIENIQRDINIAFMNEVLLICTKLKINFNEVIRLAKTKWNFLNFRPGLVGGHCLPVDPYYLSSLAAKKKLKTRITLAGRKINDGMVNYVIAKLNNFLNKKNKSIENSKIMIVGLTYKPGVADMRNSLNFEIFKKIKKKSNKTFGCDPFVGKKNKLTYKIHKTIANHIKYDAIVFLSYHDFFEKKFRKIIKSKNKNNILDPFNYYS